LGAGRQSFVVAARDVKGVSGLWRVDRTTAEVSSIGSGTYDAGDLGFEGWSPDGRKIYYHRMQMLSADQVLVPFERGLESGVEKELIRGNLGGATISPDGQYIATSTADLATKSQSIMLVPVSGGEPRVLMRVTLPQSVIDRWILTKNLNQLNMLRILWAPDGRSLVVEHTQAKPEQWWVTVDGRQPPKRVSLGVNLWNVRVHPDGRRIAMAVQQPRRSDDVWVLDHFLPKGASRKASVARR
jgi:Tol biopolymer transport system component